MKHKPIGYPTSCLSAYCGSISADECKSCQFHPRLEAYKRQQQAVANQKPDKADSHSY